jgi:hypothetical protein
VNPPLLFDSPSRNLEQVQECHNGICKGTVFKKSKFAQETNFNESTSIDLEIIIREGLIKTSVDKYFNGATFQHTLNFVPHYNNYTCKDPSSLISRCQDSVRTLLSNRIHPFILQTGYFITLGLPHPIHIHPLHDHPNENKKS